jgi:hypothetical protein
MIECSILSYVENSGNACLPLIGAAIEKTLTATIITRLELLLSELGPLYLRLDFRLSKLQTGVSVQTGLSNQNSHTI